MRLPESAILQSTRQFFTGLGCHVYSLPQGRTTRQTPGLPDLWVMHPTKGGWWVEGKRPGGKASEAQQLFADRCAAAGVGYIQCSDVRTLEAFARHRGLLTEVPHGR